MQVFAGAWESRNTNRGGGLFFVVGLAERKIRLVGSAVLSFSSNSEGNARLIASLGPADV